MSHKNPQQFYTVPTPVEAWKLSEDNLDLVARWCRGSRKGLSVNFPKIRDKTKMLNSEDTRSYAIVGQYIVKVAKGFKVVPAEEFERTHRPGTIRV